VPRPYVLDPPADASGRFLAGSRLAFGLTLVGTGRGWLPQVLPALAVVGQLGLGADRQRWELARVEAEGLPGVWHALAPTGGPDDVPESTATDLIDRRPAEVEATLRFHTPTLFKEGGRITERPSAGLLFRRLLRQIGDLAREHCGAGPESFDFRPLLADIESVRTAGCGLRAVRWERYSNRRNESHPLQGSVGDWTLTSLPASLWPYLLLGKKLHVGGGASFGQGKYEVLHLPV
jgi:hypothetical protein